ncbi:MAG TPA: hypothetical protein VJA21_13550 [Verrucomicrobiae bacterium]
MRQLWFILFLGLAAGSWAQDAVPEESRSRFCAVDIYLDAKGAPLAAYQLEFAVTNGAAKVVGIEGGDHPAFRDPPFYDPKAMQQERVVVAAFSTEPAARLPNGRTRVATIHLHGSGGAALQFELKVGAGGDSDGKRIFVEASGKERKDQ